MWSLPLLTLDIGRVMSGLVGSSEQRMREAISQVEAIAPCILRVDEIEKSLSGTKSSGQTDGGTLSRVFGTFLTAMEEGMKDVVVIACVDGKTVIQLSNGQMCLAENMITENKLLSTDFNTGELVTTNPSFRTNPTTNILYTVNTTTSRISCSHNHPFFSIDINGNINEVAAENLSKGMFLAAPLIIPEPEDTSLRILESVEKTHGNQKNINLPSILNEDLSYLVGYTTGDGGKSGRPGQNFPDRISWNDCNKGMINTIKNLSEDLFKVNCNIYENIRESSNVTYYAYIDSNILGEWFSKHFSDSIRARGPNRQVPLEIQKSNNSIVANYLSGIFDAEGWVQGEDNKFQIGWVTTSYILVQQISMLFRRFGIYPTLSSGFSKSSFTKNMIYRLHISSYEQQKLFYKYINFRHPDKKEKLENFLSTFNPQKSMGYYATNIPVPTELVLKLTKKYGIQQKRLDNFIQTKFASKTHIPTVTRSLFNKWINVLSEYIIDRDEDFEKLKILSKYQWDRVKDVTFTEGETKVYDFHIPELHNYIASGLIVHNTANDISALPPELIRRFNEVLFVDLPQPEEREEIFKIHLAKRKRDMSKLKLDVNKIVAATHLFTGSEIEKVVKESIARAFRQKKKDVTTKIILNVCNETKPIATIMKEKIDAIREWARNRARYASSLAAAANAPGAQHVTTKSGKELDLSDDLDDLDEAVKTSKEEKVKNNNEFAQFNGILEE
jgi:intein/homing endonuclease